ncbi:dNA mismatch repair protein MutS [Clostridium sp. CAG:230]|jgi:DNA mismatch repair protein MutS|nr:DNA mismatch repair protein MutS [Jutongia hominis]CDA88164.1 dNA mismatch repair protein MutS [Clostridium sp. CAG:230]
MPLTPMMQKYVETKEEYKDCILFYRLGDFYEMFFEDAKICSQELELTLTGKSCGLEERAPMCGVPFHAVDGYLNKLVSKGYKVAICEQVEDPKLAKGLVKRAVTRVVTPGTNLDTKALDESRNNYLMCVVYTTNAYGVSYVDVTTGDYYLAEFESENQLLDEIGKVVPSEIICNDPFLVSGIDFADLQARLGMVVSAIDAWYFDEDKCYDTLKHHFKVGSLNGLGLDGYSIGIIAAGAALEYLEETQKISLDHITKITPYVSDRYMLLDRATRRNLELCETMREKAKRGSLFWVLDKTKTAMGARMLRNAIEQPLLSKEEIDQRLDTIEALNQNAINREEIREYLGPIYDLERLISKISYRSANPRDLIAFRQSLSMLPPIKQVLNSFEEGTLLKQYGQEMDALEDLFALIDASIMEEPPLTVREGGMIKDGYNEEVDHLRRAKTDGKQWLADLLEKEKERTDIKNLKIKYNKVFGYYLEVTNSYKDLVPDDWTRKQTLANAERYTTPRLKELEDSIMGAEDRLCNLEYSIFCDVREKIYAQIGKVQTTAKIIAAVDMFASLALVAEQNNYVRPQITTDGKIDIREGRHPVVEKMIRNDMFVSNDTYLDDKKHKIAIITGPNMAGKSTYMRQTALLVLMAQIGSFVPAQSAQIGIVDRIFTRVGASDDLASGQSTFMIEMTEVANILRNATKNSLIILDEIGRGTSTFDGLSIAWAVVEYIANTKLLGAKTLFATHYHELTELEGKLESVDNYCIAVKEQGEDIVFLRKIIKGGADKSYGIQVAKLAGVPENVLKRAREIVQQLSDHDIASKAKDIEVEYEIPDYDYGIEQQSKRRVRKKTASEIESEKLGQLSLFDTSNTNIKMDDIILELHDINLSDTTPIEALNILYKMQEKLKERM